MTNNEYIIDVKGLTKSYDKKCVVCNVDLQVKPGEIFGFLGPNGSGKTTTIRMLCGLLKPDAGEGTCLGYDILTESLKIKLQVGYMTQRFSLYNDLTIRENLDFIARIYNIKNRTQRVNECVNRLGFSKKRQNQITGTLSGGWKQRLALAAAMLHNPKLLLLDEPTAGVDPKARREFWEQIHNLAAEGITALVSTHYMDEAERCHRLTYIAYGHLLTTGNIEEVIKHANLSMWKVTGPNISDLSHKLQQQSGIEQVTAFGQSLHVVSQNPDALEKAIAPFKTSDYKWEKSTADLEDVFIHLVAEAKDNFA
ncbi:MAG: ABC transporter ATP-binding protein [Gammaproteobacteria bacterium]|jgi:ABC-2 type transport system ATP-binding protein